MNVQINTEAWLEERRHFVGGSEVAALFDVSPYMTHYELWQQKAGNYPSAELDGERIEAGQFMETAIAQWATHRFDMKMRKVHRYMPHTTVAGMGASLDYEAYGDGAYVPVELKNVDGQIFREKWATEGRTITYVPDHILLQCQQQMACANAQQCWLIVCVGGNSLYRLLMAREEAVIAQIKKRIERFWRSIAQNIPPDPDFSRDGSVISHVIGPVRGKVLDLKDSNRLPELLRQHRDASAQEKKGAAAKKAAAAEIEHMLDGAPGAIATNGKITQYEVKAQAVQYERAAYKALRIKVFEEKEEAA
ncbi:MAG: YqaJ viral recombinase family protein [Pseudomonadota bacterium]